MSVASGCHITIGAGVVGNRSCEVVGSVPDLRASARCSSSGLSNGRR